MAKKKGLLIVELRPTFFSYIFVIKEVLFFTTTWPRVSMWLNFLARFFARFLFFRCVCVRACVCILFSTLGTHFHVATAVCLFAASTGTLVRVFPGRHFINSFSLAQIFKGLFYQTIQAFLAGSRRRRALAPNETATNETKARSSRSRGCERG